MCLNVICMNTFYFFEKNIYFHALIISAYCFKYLPIYKKKKYYWCNRCSTYRYVQCIPNTTYTAVSSNAVVIYFSCVSIKLFIALILNNADSSLLQLCEFFHSLPSKGLSHFTVSHHHILS